MGNLIPCFHSIRPVDNKDLSPNLSLMTTSVTQKESIISHIMHRKLSAKKSSSSFKWSRMQSMFLEPIVDIEANAKLSFTMLKRVKNVFDLVEADLVYYGVKFQNTMVIMDKSYVKHFNKSSKLSTLKCPVGDLDFKMYLHNMSMFKLHQMIIELFLVGGHGKVMEIFEMLALSHLLIKVTESDFRLHSMAMIKFFQRFKMMTDTETKYVVEYFNIITKFICEFMDKRSSHNNLIDEMTNEDANSKSTARDNYRTLKKWTKVVQDLRMSIDDDVSILLDCLPSTSESYDVATDIVNKILQNCFAQKAKEEDEEEIAKLSKQMLDMPYFNI